MGIKNLTETEEKEFYRLVGKMNGEEPDKKQDAKVKKPEYGDTVYYIDYIGRIRKRTWINDEYALDMWELGNIFFTKKESEFAREKRKVEVELERYAKEHNDSEKEAWDGNNFHFEIACGYLSKECICVSTNTGPYRGESITYFTSKEIAEGAIKSVGKDRILKYIFGVESEGEE